MNKTSFIRPLAAASLLIFTGASLGADPATPTQASTTAPATSPADMAAGMRVVKDPLTGQLRAPTAEEARALEAAAAKSRSSRSALLDTVPVRTVTLASGAVGVEVPESAYSYFAVTRAADGSLVAACAEGEDAAMHAAHQNLLTRETADESQ